MSAAEAEYRRAIELEPGNDDAYRRLGQVLEQNNQLEDALAAYHKALQSALATIRTTMLSALSISIVLTTPRPSSI